MQISDDLPPVGQPSGLALMRDRFINTPVAMRPEALEAFLSEAAAPELSRFTGRWDPRSRLSVTDEGIAIVGVYGVLVNRGAWLGPIWGCTSYEGLAEQFRRLAADREIRGVVLDIDSGGGEAAGLFELMPALDALKDKKPVHAIANTCAASAAYAIGCAAHELHVTPSGMTGSIGVVAMHMSVEKALERWGYTPTLITYGRLKAAGNPYEPLGAEARGIIQANVDRIGEGFVQHVAKYRGLAPDAVRSTEARVYGAADAVDLRLADGVTSFDDLLLSLRNPRSARSRASSIPGGPMSGAPGSAAPSADLQSQITEALSSIFSAKAGKADETLTRAEAEQMAAAAATKAVADDRARIFAILGHEASQGRESMARKLAASGLSIEQAVDLLNAAPKAEQAPNGFQSALAAEMQKPGNAGGVKPDAAAAPSNRPSLADKVKAKFSKGA